MHWDEKTFDVNMNKWTKRCYETKDYRHLADYIRIWALLKYGGIYMDTDVELLKPIDELINTDKNIVGIERTRIFHINTDQQIITDSEHNGKVAVGLFIAINPDNQNDILKNVLNKFDEAAKISDDVLMDYTNQLFIDEGLDKDSEKIQYINEYKVYPPEYFCPIPWQDNQLPIEKKVYITNNTYTIHHYNCK